MTTAIRRFVPPLAVALSLALGACGGGGGGDEGIGDEDRIGDVIESAFVDPDPEEFCGQLLSQDFVEEAYGSDGCLDANLPDFDTVEVSEIEVDDVEATARAEAVQVNSRLDLAFEVGLVRDGEDWRIDSVTPVESDDGQLEPDEREGTPPEGDVPGLEEAADAAGCELRLNLPDEGNQHLAPSSPDPAYGTTPPSSGSHDPIPTPDGAYLETPPARDFVHSLEHGRIELQYAPELGEDEQLQVKGIYDQSPDKMLIFPNEDMPYAVAATAWRNLLGCEEFSDEAIGALVAFRDRFRGRGPERIP
jgi:uncharacterized protein DUF3105